MRTIQHKRGLKANLPELAVGEFGFTTDEGGVYIGSLNGNLKVSYSENMVTTILSANGWSNKKYSFESSYPNTEYNLEVFYNGDEYSEASFETWNSAQMVGSASQNIITANGEVPTVDIPVFLKVVRK